ncbi:DEAD/DEAH box helicase family protein [Microvirga sp. 0TCS3.31]
MAEWAGIDGDLAREIVEQSDRCLDTYRKDARRVEQDAAIETSTAQGGYGRKQLYELIQNGADALLGSSGRIHVVLTRDCLYVANEGKTLSSDGIISLMASHLSRKRGDEIGRFGLGFKSVVAISDRPQIFSRSVSIGFDREHARARIAELVLDGPYPMLRVAEPLDPHRIADEDPVLAELMTWAATVVRVPLLRGYDDLASDVRDFPAEFLLFSPHAKELMLEDRQADVRRVIRVRETDGGALTLDDDGTASVWRVAVAQHRPSKRALEDAGELAHRDTISVWWAVPLRGRAAVGRFWAFFPTEDRTTLSGIVNAPWKMGDDRRNLLPGRFNEEILAEVLPALMSREWHHLVDPEDPASVLDVLPARGRESRSWADDVANEPVFRQLARTPSLPDVTGALQQPGKLRLHPRSMDPDLLDLWSALSPPPEGWAHHGIDRSPERRLKAERLVGDSEFNRPPTSAWIEALLADGTVASSAIAVSLVDALVRTGGDYALESRRAKVLLLEDGSYAAAVPGQVFVRSSPEDAGFQFIHPDLGALPAVVDSLARLGIQVLDRAGELRNLLSSRRGQDLNWAHVWSLARQCTPSVAVDVFRDELPAPLETSIRVRTRGGKFASLGAAYLPGGVVGASDSANADTCVDISFHALELELLTELGAVAQPVSRSTPPEEAWVRVYADKIQDLYIAEAKGAKPHPDKLEIVGEAPPWPMEPLARLSPTARVALTTIVLGMTSVTQWKVRHRTNASYGVKSFPHPVHWYLNQHGRLDTVFGPMAPAHCLLASDDHPEDALPVAPLSSATAAALQVKASPEELPREAWQIMLSRIESWADVRRTARVYAWAAWFADAPRFVLAQVGQRTALRPPADVAVVHSEETFRSLVEQQQPVILVEDENDFLKLQEQWGLEDGNRLLEQELVFQASGEPQVLVDLYPKLRLYLQADQQSLELQACDALDLVTATRDGLRSRPVTQAFEEGRVLVTATQPERILASVSAVLQLDLTPADIRSIIDNVREQKTEKLITNLRNADSDEARLGLLVGEEKLRRALPASAIEAIEAEQGRAMTELEMARLVRSVHGVGALHHFRGTLEERGLNPPHAWAGGSKARRFVADLGFSPEFAGFATDQRPAAFAVEGPAELGDLHDYQKFVTERIKDLLRGDKGRGMVSLPTGAGKTRVAVQALIEEIRDGDLQGPIVWIAQSEELCEQAVESWTYIWRAMGPAYPLTVGRLWSSNEVGEVSDGVQLVVATPDKLDTKINNPDYDWLTEPTVVVVDEAHTSVAPSYTRVLAWLGRGRSRKGGAVLLGLTATPFRNTNVAETERLVARYDSNRLDQGAFETDPYTELQARGVLARVDHRLLAGATVDFTDADNESMDKMRTIPANVLSKLAADSDRNRRIVDSVASLPDDWTTLLFATSVDNAMALAALLSHRGVPAVAIAGTTDPAARRYYIEEFKQGRIRVITNYNVLTQGFDAPAVKAVYVTRPTFSANLYQQMIGRGLRGPLNGGSEEVLIVNVEDNFQQFGDRLAFLEFEHLWDPDLAAEVD